MARVKEVQNMQTGEIGSVPFTPEEEALADVNDAQGLIDAPKVLAMKTIRILERQVTIRRLIDAQTSTEGLTWLEYKKEEIALERVKL
jgi:hypothetical protein